MKEIWKEIQGYVGLYQVSNLGRVKSKNRNWKNNDKIIRQGKDRDGYLQIVLYKNKIGKMFKVHRIVALAFILNPENKPQVNHINGIKDDNRVENLEWCTSKENMTHAWKINLSNSVHCQGEKCHLSKLTEDDIYVIKGLLEHTSLSQTKIAEIFDVKQNTISRIKLNKRWKHLNNK